MAWVVRAGVSKLPSCSPRPGLCKVTPGGNNVAKMQVAFITGRALRVGDRQRPAPYPYKEKSYNLFNYMYDKITHRFDDNSKLVVVEGPIASGKTKFAKALAADLEMEYFPAVTMDNVYVNDYGYDLRQLDPQLPEGVRSFDEEKFCRDPHNTLVANFQIQLYKERYSQYINALAHILSTGQGVVLERSPFSDFVFMDAMFNSGYISRGAKSVYNEIKAHTITEIWRPHLVIYLDVPVPTVKDNIKKRGIPYEVNSKAFTDKYLQDIENNYKQKYLKDISQHANLLIYDWTEAGDVEVVVEDIERLNFDDYDKHEHKMSDWRQGQESDWYVARRLFAARKDILMCYFNIPRFDVPELISSAEDNKIRSEVYDQAPGNKYLKGYNADMGDVGILFKTAMERYKQM